MAPFLFLAAMGTQQLYGVGVQRSGVCMLFREFLLQNDFQVQWVDQILPGCSCKRADIDVTVHVGPGFRVGSIAVQEKVEGYIKTMV